MRREWRYWLRSALPRCLCLFIAFSTILLNTSIESNASTIKTDVLEDVENVVNVYASGGTNPSGNDFELAFNLPYTFTVGTEYTLTMKGQYFVNEYTMDNCSLSSTYIKNGYITFGDSSQPLTTLSTGMLFNGSYSTFTFSFVAESSKLSAVLTGNETSVCLTTDYTKTSEYSYHTMYKLSDIELKYAYTRSTNEILEDIESVENEQLEQQEEQTETQKGIFESIKEFFGSFFQNLIDSIIHVIVPTSEEMSDLFNRLNDFFAETFGFLYYPFDFIIDAFNIFLEADSETGLTLPAFSIMGYEVWGDLTYDINSEPIIGTIFGYVRIGTGAMLAMWFVNYLRNFFDKRFGGGGN